MLSKVEKSIFEKYIPYTQNEKTHAFPWSFPKSLSHSCWWVSATSEVTPILTPRPDDDFLVPVP